MTDIESSDSSGLSTTVVSVIASAVTFILTLTVIATAILRNLAILLKTEN